MMMIRFTFLLSIFCVTAAFLAPGAPAIQNRPLLVTKHEQRSVMFMAPRDKSRSGTKRDRLDKLAELEDSRVETDKSFVGLAAGGFVGLIVLLLAVAFASGVLDPVSTGGY